MRSISRLTGAAKGTVARLLMEAGQAADEVHHDYVWGLEGTRYIECDELWSFIYAKRNNVSLALAPPKQAGDTWTWLALDSESKLVVAYLIGPRDEQSAIALMDDLDSRLEDRPQITTDGLRAYMGAVEGTFGGDVDFVQILKQFDTRLDHDGSQRYEPAEQTGVMTKRSVEGNPDLARAGTSYVERVNLTLRMGNRRFTRLTNGYSKCMAAHEAMLHLFFFHYNWCRVHSTLGVTPAMAAGLDEEASSFRWLVEYLDEWAPKPNRPKRYRKRK